MWSLEDGRSPKKALTSYMIFVKDRKVSLMAENPTTSFRDMMQLVAERWRALTPEEKYHYEKKA